MCTFHRQQKRCQGELYCLYSSASNNRRGNSGNDSVYFARSWSGNRERGGSVVRWCRYHVQWQRGGSASIRERSPKAVYVHCSGHYLNLVISHSCALPQIRNEIDKLKRCCLYFLGSPKREGKADYSGTFHRSFVAIIL